jgi:hypothetical protein
MHFLLINRTRPDLSAEDYAELGRLAQGFYDDLPAGIRLHSDWAALDGSGTYALIEVDDEQMLEGVQEPFRRFVDMEVIPVEPISGWGRRPV